MTQDLIYPYLVTDAYPGAGDPVLSRPVGHGLEVQLIRDHDGLVGSCTAADVAQAGGFEAALASGLDNLQRLLKGGEVTSTLFRGPGGQPFLLMGGHWATATCLLLPGLTEPLVPHLGPDLVASVPHRDAMLVFARGDRAYRDQLRTLVREKESDGAKPLTFELFALTATGPVPFTED